jgi:hypothetical protein
MPMQPVNGLGGLLLLIGMVVGLPIAKRGSNLMTDVEKEQLRSISPDPIFMLIGCCMLAVGLLAARSGLWAVSGSFVLLLVGVARIVVVFGREPWSRIVKAHLVAGTLVLMTALFGLVLTQAWRYLP